jgi:hypothetical protein
MRRMTYPPPEPQPGQPVQPAGPTQPVQKSKAGPIIAIVAIVVLVLCLGCAGSAWYFFYRTKQAVEDVVNNLPSNFPTNGPEAPQNNATSHTVRYEVSGSGKVQIIYAKGSGGQEVVKVDLPWSQEITVNAKNFGLTVIAVKDDKDASLDGCKIVIDGAEKKTGVYSNNTLNCSYVFLG